MHYQTINGLSISMSLSCCLDGKEMEERLVNESSRMKIISPLRNSCSVAENRKEIIR